MAKIKKSWRLSDVALQRLNALVELENKDAVRYQKNFAADHCKLITKEHDKKPATFMCAE